MHNDTFVFIGIGMLVLAIGAVISGMLTGERAELFVIAGALFCAGLVFLWASNGSPLGTSNQPHNLTGVVQYASADGKQLVVDNVTINCKGADCGSIENGDYVTLQCAVNQDADALADFVCTYVK